MIESYQEHQDVNLDQMHNQNQYQPMNHLLYPIRSYPSDDHQYPIFSIASSSNSVIAAPSYIQGHTNIYEQMVKTA
jgi:hypothetical protein